MIKWIDSLMQRYRKSSLAGGRITLTAESVTEHHGGFLIHEQLRNQGYSLVRIESAPSPRIVGLLPVFVNKEKTKAYDFKLQRIFFDEWQMVLTLNEGLTQLLQSKAGGVTLLSMGSIHAARHGSKRTSR